MKFVFKVKGRAGSGLKNAVGPGFEVIDSGRDRVLKNSRPAYL